MNEGGQEYRKALANRKAKIKRKSPLGSRTQSPDQQYATGMMGKQPIMVYPALKKRGM